MSTCTITLPPANNAGLPTLAEARASNELITATGNCNNSSEFAEYINNATERLMYRGDWPGTELPILISVKRGVVTFPRQVGTVRKINVTKRYVPVWNDSYAFMPWNWKGNAPWLSWIDPLVPALTQYGTSCTFDQPPTNDCVLQISGISDDDGAILTFFGVDPSGNALRTDNGDGTWSDGIQMQSSALTTGTVLVKFISRAIKPKTQGSINLYSLDTITGVQTPLAVYDPGETNPSFAQYNLHANCCRTNVTWSAVALVKLKFIPVSVDTDMILIPNLHALALFIKGMRFADAGDRINALSYQADAVKELNLQLADNSPEEQTPIQINPFGSAPPWRSGIGRII